MPVEGVKVPVIVRGVPDPVRVRVFEPFAVNTWEALTVRFVTLALEAKERVVSVVLTATTVVPKSCFDVVLSVSV